MSTAVSTSGEYEALDCSDDEIVEAVLQADPMAARGLLYFLAGDEEVAAVDAEIAIRSGDIERARTRLNQLLERAAAEGHPRYWRYSTRLNQRASAG